MNRTFSNIKTIAKRELASYFNSPVAYIFLIIFLVLTAFFTFNVSAFFERNEASLSSFFTWHPWLYLVLVPAIGMRQWAEERRSGTIEMLFTLPVTAAQAIFGKFFAGWIFLGLALILTFPMVITVNYLGNPDNGVILTGYIGSFLVAGVYLAITILTSAFTRSQIVSFITSVVICLFLVLAGWPPVTRVLPPWLDSIVAKFSVMPHYQTLQRGMVDVQDLFFFVSVMAFALFATGVVLRSRRAG